MKKTTTIVTAIVSLVIAGTAIQPVPHAVVGQAAEPGWGVGARPSQPQRRQRRVQRAATESESVNVAAAGN